jgi:hypothetical protein
VGGKHEYGQRTCILGVLEFGCQHSLIQRQSCAGKFQATACGHRFRKEEVSSGQVYNIFYECYENWEAEMYFLFNLLDFLS